MAIEREIKLALPLAQTEAAIQFFTARTGMTGQAMQLDNIYFDTPRRLLSQSKSALRLRHTPNGWLQTLKTTGVMRRGLATRHEWEMPVASEALDISQLLRECDDTHIVTLLRNAAPTLIALFRTDFMRTLWPLHMENADIEIAIDQGEIVADVNGDIQRAPISEIELELKRGDANALHAFATQLIAQIPDLVPDDVSKAQRGFELTAEKSGWLESQFDALPVAWRDLLRSFIESRAYAPLCRFVDSERDAGKTIYPASVFHALHLVAPSAVKIVILGQDPYHGEDNGVAQAHGLAFSVPPGVRLPPSLRNIFREISDSLGLAMSHHGCLDAWARQGVLLLNTVLTVECGHAASHAKRGWESCTDTLIHALATHGDHLVFMLWGAHAQAKHTLISEGAHCILEAPHPSPLSAHRGFFGCRHFVKANEYLKAHGREPIDWELADPV